MSDGPNHSNSVPELSGEATRLQDSPWGSPPMQGEATRIQDSPLDAAPLGGPPPPPGARPRLGGPGDPGMSQAKTLMANELAGAVAEATRMVAMPDGPPSVVVAGQPGMGQPMGMQPMGMQPMQPMGMGGPPPMGMGPPPPYGAPQGPPGPGGFAPPPGFDAAPPPVGKSGGGFPVRTAAMVGALVLAILVLAFLGLGDDEEEYVDDAPPGPVAAAPSAVPPVPASAVAPPVLPPPLSAVPGVAPVPAVPGVAPVGVAPVPAVPGLAVPPPPPATLAPPPPATDMAVPPATAVDPSVPLPPTPERLAADQVLTNHYDQALVLYQQLALQHPERPEYSAMVRILTARIRAAQCVNGIGPDGRPCAAR